jgi:lipoic acid synthetase
MKEPGIKLKGEHKFTRKKIELLDLGAQRIKKPSWIKTKLVSGGRAKFEEIKNILQEHKLHTVCEEATCPNLGECFAKGTATFMIMGDICTRRCPFCDVAHGSPLKLDKNEPRNLAKAIYKMKLRHVVITSVNRDDLPDGGASHFANCIQEIRKLDPSIKIETLTPDFRKRAKEAVEILQQHQPDILNHNIETVPSLYKEVRPGADYKQSLELLHNFYLALGKDKLTKSGLMMGIGETMEEVENVLEDLHKAKVSMITIGQYLQPTKFHLPLVRYVDLEEFKQLETTAKKIGFRYVASGPMVRSSYHAENQLL